MSVRPRQLARRLLEPRPGSTRRIPFGPARGIRFEADSVLSLDYWLGLYEYELATWLRRLCQAGTWCVDVGAYNAYYALTLAKLTQAPVVSYEPDSEAIERCRRNVALNPTLAPLIELRAVFVGGRSTGASVTLDDELLPRAGSARSSCWLLKLDVEGAELEVLRGAERFLELMRPHLIVETHSGDLEDACGQTLRAAGYFPRVVTQRRVLRQDRSWPPGVPSHNRWLVAVGRGQVR
jgi:hypothetical protein